MKPDHSNTNSESQTGGPIRAVLYHRPSAPSASETSTAEQASKIAEYIASAGLQHIPVHEPDPALSRWNRVTPQPL